MALPSIPQAPQLPAHLAKLGNLGMSLNESVLGGMSQGGGHPSISIKLAKWRIREGANEELVNSFTLDVIIVNANKHLSKMFYEGAYKGEEGKAPDCFSDNGSGPSIQSGKPQHSNCATCPKNVWGSKVTEAGAKIKACSDYKKLAVVLADDPSRDVYELRIPGASLKELNTIMTKLIKSQVPIPAIVFQLSFDATVDYPKVLFKPLGYISETQAEAIEAWVDSDEAKEAVGELDSAILALPQEAVRHEAPKKEEDTLSFLNSINEPEKLITRGRGRPPKVSDSIGKQAPEADAQLSLDLPGVQTAAKATSINPQLTDEGLDNLLADIL